MVARARWSWTSIQGPQVMYKWAMVPNTSRWTQELTYMEPWTSWILAKFHPKLALSFHPKLLVIQLWLFKWKFIHFCLRDIETVGGYPYRAGFRPVPRVIISRLSLRTFPGVTMRLCDLWTLTITISDFIIMCDYISHLTPHGFELMSWAQVSMWQPD